MSVAISVVGEAVRLGAPYAAAALAGAWAERAGVVQIGLEAVLLGSAFATVAAAHPTGSPLLGALAAVAAGVAISLVHGALVLRLRVDAILSGMALNLAAFAGTRLALRGLWDSASNSPSIAGFALGPEGTGAAALARALLDPITVLVLVAAAASPLVLSRTRLGLRVRAVGEAPEAAEACGVSVTRTRLAALAISGALGGLGGAHLSLDLHRFEAGMSAGRGFVALAAVVLARRDPALAALACFGFGALEAAQIPVQSAAGAGGLRALVQGLPYLVTLLALSVAAARERRLQLRSGGGGASRRAPTDSRAGSARRRS